MLFNLVEQPGNFVRVLILDAKEVKVNLNCEAEVRKK